MHTRCRCRAARDAARWVERTKDIEATLRPFSAANVARSIARAEAEDRVGGDADARFDQVDAALLGINAALVNLDAAVKELRSTQVADRQTAAVAFFFAAKDAETERRAAEEARTAAEEAHKLGTERWNKATFAARSVVFIALATGQLTQAFPEWGTTAATVASLLVAAVAGFVPIVRD